MTKKELIKRLLDLDLNAEVEYISDSYTNIPMGETDPVEDVALNEDGKIIILS